MNEFDSQKEILFITYDDVIKSSKLAVVKKLLTPEYKDNFSDSIDYSKIENLSDNELKGFIIKSQHKNIIEELAIEEFDYDATYDDIYSKSEKEFNDLELLAFAQSLFILMQQKFFEKAFIYTPTFDERIAKDIFNLYPTSSFVYVYGDFDYVVNKITENNKVTTYVLNDVSLVYNLLKLNKVEYTNIIIAAMGLNYTMNDNGIAVLKLLDSDKLSKERIFKLAVFDPDPDAKISTK